MVLEFVKHIHASDKLKATIRKGNISSEKIAQALGLHQEKSDIDAEDPLFAVWR